ncbi:MAG: helix-turn-helix transcriptional regulator [Muribaculaceae bacterium]|nr:helix-turn-helix transcriptional regulator [Muribaculaceae bacterium]
MRDLIADNSLLLMVISRFGIPLREGNQTINAIAKKTGIDADTFLSVANLISGKEFDISNTNLGSLLVYLKRAHSYFLDFCMPQIRTKLISAIDYSRSHDMALVILRFFDEYVEEVRRHMNYENDTLFDYVEALVGGRPVNEDYNIGIFAEHHDAIAMKLKLLKDVLIRYYPEGNADLLNSVLFDIISCEQDLISHCDVEDRILVPAVERAEASAVRMPASGSASSLPGANSGNDKAVAGENLGNREREIITCIARGMSNKEIAEKLCISVHTVTTHRRNICSKLEIHSPAGLTVFAILNGLIDPREIDL